MTDQELHDKIVDKVVDRSKDEFYENFDAAVDRWLDKQFARFGRWAIGGMAAALFAWGLKIWLLSGGALK